MTRRTRLCLSLLLVLMACFALLPAQALAAGDFDTPRELEMLSESPAPVFRSSGEITVYFTDTLNWGTPNIYYWPNGGEWPGVAMTFSENNVFAQSVYKATIPAGTTGIIFNYGLNQTVDITEGIADGAMWYTTREEDDGGHNCVEYVEPSQQPASESTQPSTQQPTQQPSEPGTEEPAGESAFYLVGSMTGWQPDDAYRLSYMNEGEYAIYGVKLESINLFKVVYVEGEEKTWYPNGMDNDIGQNGEIPEDGYYDVYFRPNYDGGEGWFYNCIYVAASEQPTQQPSEPNTQQPSEQGPQTPDIYVLAGTDNFIPSGWILGQDSPVMTEGDDGIYSCTVENVEAVENAQYQFRVVQLPGGDYSCPIWHGLDGGDQNVAFSLSETCDVTVTYDPDTGVITVSGDGVIEPSTQLSAIYAVGSGKNGFLNNVSWNPAAEANLMTEVADGVYQITYSGIDTDETYPYEFKFAANGGWAVNWGIGSGDVYYVDEADAVLDEDLIYNAGNILFSLEDCEDDYVDVTLELDLSQWDADTQTGAKFSIIVGSEQPTEPLTEQPTEQPTEPSTEQPTQQPSELPTVEPQTEAYYLVGTMNGWSADNAYKLTCLDESEVDEYILRNVQLTTDDSFKILYSSDGSSYGMWYPEGMGNSFGENGEIVEDGTYDVYFRPDGQGGEDWFYNCIYVVASEPTEPSTQQPTQQPSELPTEQPTNELTVYFVDALNWDTPYIYYWNYGPEWPGVEMTFSESNDYAEPVYKATIPAGTTGIIFNSNGNQTVDITEGIADGAMWYTTGDMNEGRYIVNLTEHPSEQPSEEPSEEPVFGEPDFTLPRDIKSIEASAFESADMSVVYIPDGCESIGVNAFRYCTSLRQIHIPASVTTIDQTAFTGCKNVVVFGAENSRAQEIAEHYKDYGFVFVAETAMVNLE